MTSNGTMKNGHSTGHGIWLPPTFESENDVTPTSDPPPFAAKMERYYEQLDDWVDRQSEHKRYSIMRAPLSRDRKDFIGDVIAQADRFTGDSDMSRQDQEALEQFYSSSLFVYAGVFAIATNLAAIPFIATTRQDDGSYEDDPDSDLQQLLDMPGDGVSMGMLVQSAVTSLMLGGTGFLMGVREHDDPGSPQGNFVGFRALRTSRMKIVPGEGPLSVERYIHDVAGKKSHIHPFNMALLRTNNPNNDYWGQSPVAVICRTLKMDSQIEIFNETTLEAGGVPDVSLESDERILEANARRIRRRWEDRFNKGKTGGAVVLGDGLKVKPLGFSPKDMQWESMSKVTEHRILAALGVPPIMVMDLRDASVLANADTQRRMFYEVTLWPIVQIFETMFNWLLQQDIRFAGRQRARFAWEKVDILQKDEAQLHQQAREDYESNLITLNEFREQVGLDPVDDGDQFKNDRNPPPPPPGPQVLQVPSENDDELPKSRIRVEAMEAFKTMARASHRSLTRTWSGRMEDGFKTLFKDQAKRARAAIRDFNGGKKAHRTDDFADESLLALMFDSEREDEELAKMAGPIVMDAMVDAGNAKLETLLAKSDIKNVSPEDERFRNAAEKAVRRITKINAETKAQLRDVLTIAFADGWDVTRLEKEIAKAMKRWTSPPKTVGQSRARRIAVTETNISLNTGVFETAMQVTEAGGLELYKSWLQSGKANQRDNHVELDVKTSAVPIPMSQPFDNGLMYPCDPDGDVSEVVNCGCSLIEVVVRDGRPV